MSNPQRIVIKLGTSTLTGGGVNISPPCLVDLARRSPRSARGARLPSSLPGNCRRARSARDRRAAPPAPKQMHAAVGSAAVDGRYQRISHLRRAPWPMCAHTRRIIPTDVVSQRAILLKPAQACVIPIVKENDTIATEEKRFGDNDNLLHRSQPGRADCSISTPPGRLYTPTAPISAATLIARWALELIRGLW